jgi:hypothetical protein
MPLKDAVIELVKEAPENSPLRLAYMQLANQIYNIQTPAIQGAMAEEDHMAHLGNVSEASQMGHEMGNRPFEPAHNVFEKHPHLLPQQGEGEAQPKAPRAPNLPNRSTPHKRPRR